MRGSADAVIKKLYLRIPERRFYYIKRCWPVDVDLIKRY